MDLSVVRQCLIMAAFVVGGGGNVAALWILYRSAKTRNAKHVLMLRALAVNDLIAQAGMLVLLNLPPCTAATLPKNYCYWKCAMYVMLRVFGLGSGCVALVMAVERWLALTRPFFYQQEFLRRFIGGVWLAAALLTGAPLAGFGLFYTQEADGSIVCHRYRDAAATVDIIYAYLFLVFGTSLCVCIAFCNSQVFVALSRLGRRQEKVLIRRVSRATISQNALKHGRNFATAEELAFAKLMAFICIVFVICWMPQMISIPLAQMMPQNAFYKLFARIADVLMCVYFTLDPYIYVLHQYMEKKRQRWHLKRSRSSCMDHTAITPNNTPTSEPQQPPSFHLPIVAQTA